MCPTSVRNSIPSQPLAFRQLDVGNESVQMADERVENAPKTIRLRILEARPDRQRKGFVDEVART
jgi:hypothetical protein